MGIVAHRRVVPRDRKRSIASLFSKLLVVNTLDIPDSFGARVRSSGNFVPSSTDEESKSEGEDDEEWNLGVHDPRFWRMKQCVLLPPSWRLCIGNAFHVHACHFLCEAKIIRNIMGHGSRVGAFPLTRRREFISSVKHSSDDSENQSRPVTAGFVGTPERHETFAIWNLVKNYYATNKNSILAKLSRHSQRLSPASSLSSYLTTYATSAKSSAASSATNCHRRCQTMPDSHSTFGTVLVSRKTNAQPKGNIYRVSCQMIDPPPPSPFTFVRPLFFVGNLRKIGSYICAKSAEKFELSIIF